MDKLGSIDTPDDEAVAVVGLGCRFPGGGHGPDAFWAMLAEGRDAVGPFPEDRITGLFHHPDPARRGRTHAMAGCFLDGVEDFDAEFFGIAPREARFIDPMFRLLMETSWEAFEDACQPPHELAGSRTGVFVGVYATDFLVLQAWQGNIELIDAYTGPGSLHSMASGRLAHAFDLQGPAMSVDTACSSSLVALHLAAESLRRDECDLALAAGVSLMLSPEGWVNLSLANMISGDGRCKTFDADADGYGRGEGCGVLVLRRLRDARARGEKVLAVVRGSAVKHDGRSASITAPNGLAQRTVVREALVRAGLRPDDIGYVETHGTGTPLGDPIELSALGDAFGPSSTGSPDLLVGSVKTNIGHLEAAAGIAGVIKTILSFEHGIIPAHLNLRNLNPRIELAGTRIRIPTEPEPWPVGRRIAGVNSFGLSGTNAHVLLEAPPSEADQELASRPTRTDAQPVVLTLSARSPSALSTVAGNYLASLRGGESNVADMAFTANTGRTHHAHRAAVVAADVPTALTRLAALSEQAHEEAGVELGVAPSAPARVAFLYSGQGAQCAGMGQQLYDAEPVFRDALDECAGAMVGHLDLPLLDVMFRDPDGSLGQTEYTQPALFAHEYALTRLWASMGIRPDAVLGHSVGAYAAACAAGVFDLPTAAELITVRGRLMQRHTEPGVMYSVLAPVETVRAALERDEDRVSIAAVNGPHAVTISGVTEAVAAVVDRLTGQGLSARRLAVSHAFHSQLMDPMLEEFERQVGRASTGSPDIAFVSDSTGEFADAGEVSEPGYWRRHVREPVRFADGVRTLVEAGCTILVEVGPGDTLARMSRHGVDTGAVRVLASLGGNEPEPERVHRALAELFTLGARIDFQAYHRQRPGRLRRLPTYPFERTTLRNEVVERSRSVLAAQVLGQAGASGPGTVVPYAGRATWLPDGDAVFERGLSEQEPHVAADHRLFGRIVVPGAYWVAAIATAAWHTEAIDPASQHVELTDLVFSQPLVLSGEEARIVQCHLSSTGQQGWGVRIRSAVDETGRPGAWTTHAIGSARLVPADVPVESGTGPAPDLGELTGTAFYRRASDRGLELGPTFRWLESARRGTDCGQATLCRPAAVDAGAVAPPGLIDACLQAIAGALPNEVMRELADQGVLLVPFTIDRLTVAHRAADQVQCEVRLAECGFSDTGRRQVVADVIARDVDGSLVVRLDGVRLVAIEPAIVGIGESRASLSYRIDWRPVSAGQVRPREPGRWLVWSDDGGIGSSVAARLEGRDEPCVVVRRRGGDLVVAHADGREEPAPDGPEQWQALLERTGVGGVLHLSALDPVSDPVSAQRSLTGGLLHLLQGCVTAGVSGVWVVTRGAERVHNERPDPAQAPLHGLVRTFGAENPTLLGGLVDLDPDAVSLEEDVRRLTDLIRGPSGEPQLALRGETWLAPRLAPIARPAEGSTGSAASGPRADASYLVTGGLGAVGLAVADWLLAHGAGCVVLNGRSEPNEDGRAAMAGLRRHGSPVHYLAADVSDAAQASALVARISSDLPPLRGLVHAAGVLDDGILPQQTWSRLAAVFAPKVGGAWNLHVATQQLSLDFFVLCSSLAGLLGTPSQAGYAAANTFLNALAGYRRANGLPALSVAWGPWAGAGMVAQAGAGERMAASGFHPMPAGTALVELSRVLAGDAGEGSDLDLVAVVDADWNRWQRTLPVRTGAALLADLLTGEEPDPGKDDRAMLSELAILPLPERIERITGQLRIRLAATLETAVERVPDDVALTSLGVDSLMGIELKNRIESSFGVAVPSALVLQGPTVSELAEHVATQIQTSDDRTEVLDRLDELSEEELDRLLAQHGTLTQEAQQR